MPRPLTVSIVGGGLSGLCTAHFLCQAGASVAVHEASDELGGLCRTIEVAGQPVERYYHHLMPSDAHAIELVNQLGLRIDWLPARVGFCDGDSSFPCTGPWDLLRLPVLSMRGRLRYLLGALRVAAHSRDLADLDNAPLDEWVERMFGVEASDCFWRPLLHNRWGAVAGRLSAAWLCQRLKKRMSCRPGLLAGEKLGYPCGSFRAVVDGLADGIRSRGARLLLGENVGRIEQRHDQLVVRGTTEDTAADVVVLALPFASIVPMQADFPSGFLDEIAAVEYVGTVAVMVTTDKPVTDFYWTNVAAPDAPFCGIVEHTNLVPAAAYAGKHITYLVRYVGHDDPTWGQPDSEVEQTFLSYLHKLTPQLTSAAIETARVFRDRATHAVRDRGFARRIGNWRRPLPNVYLANDALAYPDDRGLDVCAMVGKQVAGMIAS